MKKIAVIGMGVVGTAVFKAFSKVQEFTVTGVDKYKNGFADYLDIRNYDIAFICVPTPTVQREQDQSEIVNALRSLFLVGFSGVAVIKSTVLPGTCRNLEGSIPLIHNPEFLTAANAEQDFMNEKAILIGGESYPAATIVASAYERLRGPDVPILISSAWEYTEMAKYVHNLYAATKITFLNEVADACAHLGIGHEHVFNLTSSQGLLTKHHAKVPGPDSKFGFGGMCFPKDTEAFLSWCKSRDFSCDVLEAVSKFNRALRPEEYLKIT